MISEESIETLWNSTVMVKTWNDWVWVKVSQLSLLPGVLIVVLKLYLVWRKEHLSHTVLNRKVDTIFRIVFTYCFVYYAVDSITILLLGRILKKCYQAYFVHHLTSLLNLRLVFSPSKPFFWQETLLAVSHSFVLSYPKYAVYQYVYVSTFIVYTSLLFVSPYSTYPQCQSMKKFVPPALISFAMMKVFGCLDMLDAVNADRSSH